MQVFATYLTSLASSFLVKDSSQTPPTRDPRYKLDASYLLYSYITNKQKLEILTIS
jgi:hypothetical protein